MKAQRILKITPYFATENIFLSKFMFMVVKSAE